MQEEQAHDRQHSCELCRESINADDPDNWRQVTSWVHGPKLQSPKLREQTGRLAHALCVTKVLNGQAPDQEELF